jgi:hypothetical protein
MSMTDPPTAPAVAVRYMLEADAAPGLLSRVLQPFARCDLTPDRMWSHRQGEAMHVEVAFDALPADHVALMEGHLRRIVGVRSVVQVLHTPAVRPALLTAA